MMAEAVKEKVLGKRRKDAKKSLMVFLCAFAGNCFLTLWNVSRRHRQVCADTHCWLMLPPPLRSTYQAAVSGLKTVKSVFTSRSKSPGAGTSPLVPSGGGVSCVGSSAGNFHLMREPTAVVSLRII
jgi:hypothetical protein